MRRNEIKEKASELFAKKGYHGASMQEIADTIGITKAALYFHFKSKADLYSEVVDDIRPLLIEKWNIAVANEAGSTLENSMKTLFFTFIGSVSINHILLWKRTLLMSTLDFDQEIQFAARALMKKRDEDMVKILRFAVNERKPDISNDELSLFLFSYSMFLLSFSDWILINDISGRGANRMDMAEKLWQKFWSGSCIN